MTAATRPASGSRSRRVLALAQRAFLATALIAISVYLVLHADELSRLMTWQLLYRCLLGAAILAALHPLIGSAFFLLQRHLGIRIELGASLSAYMRRIPARYIPGGIWHSAARYADLKFDGGVHGSTLSQLFLMETALVAATGLLASGIGAWILPADSRAYWISLLQAALGFSLLLILLAWRMRRTSILRLATAAAMFVFIWVGSAGAFTLIALSTTTSATGASCSASMLGASYLIAAAQGYLAIFAPQGWGITETSFTVINPCGAPLHATLGAFVLFRVSGMLGDMVGYGAWTILFGRKVTTSPAPQADR